MQPVCRTEINNNIGSRVADERHTTARGQHDGGIWPDFAYAAQPAVATCQAELDVALGGTSSIVMVRGPDEATEPMRAHGGHGKVIIIVSGRVELTDTIALMRAGRVTARGSGYLTVLGGTAAIHDSVYAVAFAGVLQLRGGQAIIRDSVRSSVYAGLAFVEERASVRVEGGAAVVARNGSAVVSKEGHVVVRRDGRAVILSGGHAEVESGGWLGIGDGAGLVRVHHGAKLYGGPYFHRPQRVPEDALIEYLPE